MTKIPLYTEEALNVLRENVKANLQHYRDCDKKWAEAFLKEKGLEPDGYIEFPTIHLEKPVDEKTKSQVDCRNAIKLHQKLKFDDAAQASSGLIWTFLSLENPEYLAARWPLSDDDDTAVKTILTRYTYTWRPSKRELARGWIASIWRVAELTCDKDRDKNRYVLTQEAFENSDLLQHITDRYPFMNRDVTFALLEHSVRRRKDGKPLNKSDYQEIGSHINAVAGSVRIDCLSKDDVRKIIEDYFIWKESKQSGQIRLDSFSE